MAAPSDYALLKREIQAAGLFDRQLWYYTRRAVFSFGLLAGALALLVTADSTVGVVLAALLLGPAIGQAGSFTHDNGHRAIVGPGRACDLLGLFFGNFIVGASSSWWREKHNAHHAHPNDPDEDPDVNIRLLAFTQDQARLKTGVARWVTRHQAALFLFFLPFEALHFQLAGVKYLLRNRPPLRRLELAILALRTVVLVGGMFLLLPPAEAIVALAVSEASLGIFFGSIFAPNHKGMPMAPDADYLRRQVVTARNVRPNPVVDFWFIGLNYQIEHHLFPTLARNKLGAARVIVRRFCAERRVPYVEVGVLRSFVEILQGLSEASAGATAPAAAAAEIAAAPTAER
jgi:fatty acid desaturase